jgi:hypothetical protein
MRGQSRPTATTTAGPRSAEGHAGQANQPRHPESPALGCYPSPGLAGTVWLSHDTHMASVYVETTVFSYLAARPSRDVVVAGHHDSGRASGVSHMIRDPIVEEVHRIRERMWDECGGDLERLIEALRAGEAELQDRIVPPDKLGHARRDENPPGHRRHTDA